MKNIFYRFMRCQFYVVSPRPFPREGAWRKTIESQKPGNSPWPEPKVVEGQRVLKEPAAQTVRSWTVQNAMKGVLGPITAGTALRILDFANPNEIRD